MSMDIENATSVLIKPFEVSRNLGVVGGPKHRSESRKVRKHNGSVEIIVNNGVVYGYHIYEAPLLIPRVSVFIITP